MKRVAIKVYGLVQGVFFRTFIVEKAKELKLAGWVKNESDETVKILVEGDKEAIKKLIDYCQKGPELAKVERVEVKWEKGTNEFSEFSTRYD